MFVSNLGGYAALSILILQIGHRLGSYAASLAGTINFIGVSAVYLVGLWGLLVSRRTFGTKVLTGSALCWAVSSLSVILPSPLALLSLVLDGSGIPG